MALDIRPALDQSRGLPSGENAVPLRRRHRDPKLAWLADHRWWGELSEDDLAKLSVLGDRLDVPSGRLLMHHGERGLEAALIIDGEVVVSRGREVIAWLGPGEIVGELAVLDDAPRNADVRTASDVQLLVLRDADLRTALEDIASLRERVLELAARHRGGSPSETPSVTSSDTEPEAPTGAPSG
jgi:CRP/FNR family transcriptional regulator, cyclic AMP receptor protein